MSTIDGQILALAILFQWLLASQSLVKAFMQSVAHLLTTEEKAKSPHRQICLVSETKKVPLFFLSDLHVQV